MPLESDNDSLMNVFFLTLADAVQLMLPLADADPDALTLHQRGNTVIRTSCGRAAGRTTANSLCSPSEHAL